jgi:predicted permease
MRIWTRLKALLRRKQLEADMAEEMRAHLELQEQANRAARMPPDEAGYAARRQFGHLDGIKETCRDQRGWVWLEQWGRELRLAVRVWRRAPGFSLAVVCTLALCLGPNTAILSVLYSLVLKPLPFPAPDQLATISNVADKSGGAVYMSSIAQYQDSRAHADLFQGFALVREQNGTLDDQDLPIRVETYSVTPDLYGLLGVQPVLGRFFTTDEATPGRDNVLVLTQAFWESQYHADASVIGREVHMGGQPYTIVGVAPRSLDALFLGTAFFQVYAPAPFELNPESRYAARATMYARLKPGIAPGAGLAQLATLERRFRSDQASPRLRAFIDAGGYRIASAPLRNGSVASVSSRLWLLQGGALLVMLIGCVNVANLFLARANAKLPEWAIRVALGAGRGVLLRQMLAESLTLTSVAAVAGVALAVRALSVFNRYLPNIARTAPPVTLDATVASLALAAAFVMAVLVALVPFLLLGREGLRVGDSRAATSRGATRALSGALVMAQVAIAVILLVGAGLLIRSFANVVAVNPGFDAAHLVQGRIALPNRYSDSKTNVDVQRRILAAIREIPGVENVAEVSYFGVGPASTYRRIPFMLRGEAIAAGDSMPLVYIDPVSPDFFATMGIKVVAGRVFTDADDFGKNPVVVVDQTFAQRYFAGRIAVGHEVTFSQGTLPPDYKWPQIVGVVARANFTGLGDRDGLPFVYFPMIGWATGGFNVQVHSMRATPDLLREIRSKLRAIDPDLPFYAAGSLQQALYDMLTDRRGITLLLGAFSGLALLLAAVGLYGVLAYDVSQRTREIGIRGAIGASQAQIVGLILRQGMGKTGVGLAAGLAGALELTRFLRGQLFDIAAIDPASYAAVMLILLGVALLACWIPARRAAKVDPVIALRAE